MTESEREQAIITTAGDILAPYYGEWGPPVCDLIAVMDKIKELLRRIDERRENADHTDRAYCSACDALIAPAVGEAPKQTPEHKKAMVVFRGAYPKE